MTPHVELLTPRMMIYEQIQFNSLYNVLYEDNLFPTNQNFNTVTLLQFFDQVICFYLKLIP